MSIKVYIPKDMEYIWELKKLGEKPKDKYKKKAYERRTHLLQQQYKTLTIIDKYQPNLLKRTQDISLTEEQVDFILAKIYAKFKGIARKHQHNFFTKGLDRGVKDLGWNVDVPSPLSVVSFDSAAFTPHKLAQHNALKVLNKLFLKSLEFPHFQEIDPRFKLFLAGQIIFSAATNGGVLHQEWLAAIGAAITSKNLMADSYNSEKKDQQKANGLIWLELSFIRKRKKASPREYKKRWFPDPITSLLINKWIKHFGHNWVTYPDDCKSETKVYRNGQGSDLNLSTKLKENQEPLFLLRNILASYLLNLGISFKDQPRLYEFISACRISLGLHFPQYLIQYASSFDKAVSLNPQTWARLRTDQTIKVFIPSKQDPYLTENHFYDKSCKTIVEIDIDLQCNNICKDQSLKIKQLRKCLKERHNQPVIEAIERFLLQTDQVVPILQLIAYWCIERMKNHLFGKKLVPASLATYFSTFVPWLVASGYDFDLATSDVESWEELYESVLRLKDSESHIKRKVDRLKSFHSFLTQTIDAPDVNLPDLAGISGNVNVNIITHKEYQRIKYYILSNNNYPQRLRRIQLLLLMFGFLCGLRRNEAWKLLLGDIQHDQEAIFPDERVKGLYELLLRANIFRKLKTIKSVRRLPLFKLLPFEEQEAIIVWQHLRSEESEGGNKKTLLLCLEGEDTIPLYENTTFRVVTFAMKTITGDPDIRYQHLRHSFATFTLLRLVQPDHLNVCFPDWAINFDLVTTSNSRKKNGLESRSDLRSLLINSGQAEVPTSRRLLYALSLLCGHLDPEETLATYIHLLDYLLGETLKNNNKTELTLTQQAYLLDTNVNSLKSTCSQRKIKVDSPLALLSVRIKKIIEKFKDPTLATMASHKKISKIKMVAPEKLGYPTLHQLHKLLYRHYKKTNNNKILFVDRAYSEERIAMWVTVAIGIAKMKTKKGRQRLVFSKEEAHKDKKKNDSRARKTTLRRKRSMMVSIPGYCPSYPHSELTGKDAQLFYKGILKFYDQNPELTLNVLRTYVKTTSKNHPEPKFQNNKEKIDYTTFLKEIGVPQKRILIKLKAAPNTLIKTQKKYWATLLNLPEKNIRSDGKYNQDRHGEFCNGTAIIWVQGFPILKKSRKSRPVTWQTTGLNYAIYMAAVVLGGNKKLVKKRLLASNAKTSYSS